MNVTPSFQKLILTVVILLGIAYVGYTTLFGEVDTSQTNVELPVADSVGQDILILSEQLNAISIDTSIFSSPLFTSLVDLSSVVSEEETGRTNPFAPIGNSNPSLPTR